MRWIVLIAFLVSTATTQAQDFEWLGKLKNKKGTIKVLSEEAVVIMPDGDENQRYVSAQLPDELKKDGLKITFTGWVGKIPPHIRMIGTPLKLAAVCISKDEAKKHGLSKRKYKF